MNSSSSPEMLEATRLTRAGRLVEATALLQRALHGQTMPAPPAGAVYNAPDVSLRREPRLIDATPETTKVGLAKLRPGTRPTFKAEANVHPAARVADVSPRLPVGEALRSLFERFSRNTPQPDVSHESAKRPPMLAPEEVIPGGGRFVTSCYAGDAGKRAYKLYLPSGYCGVPLPLIVMLHGCGQSPDDFAAGTRMNALAEHHGCLVAYPAQAASANAQRCWNWFSPADQGRDRGEPSIIAGITRQIIRHYAVDARRIYVAGLSAGGAAAAIMGMTYPDLFAAVGVHSGLPCGAAGNLASALRAMRQGSAAVGRRPGGMVRPDRSGPVVPAIVFHGDQDTTVHPRNGDQVVAQFGADIAATLRAKEERDQVVGGRAYSRTLYTDASGRVVLEHWRIEGAGHAWSGGSLAGSYTDPHGPDASRAMLRFFFDHPR